MSTLPAYYHASVVPSSLRNRVCRLCRAAIDPQYELCFQCNSVPDSARPDVLGFGCYAIKGRQLGTDMHRYKAPQRSVQAVEGVLTVLGHAVSHRGCAGALAGSEIDAVAVVPSRSHHRAGSPSALERLCEIALEQSGLPFVEVSPSPGSKSDRKVRADAFIVHDQDVPHALVVDDTWVSGGSVLSTVWSLRDAGVARVSALVVARWLDPSYPATGGLVAEVDRIPGWKDPLRACPFTLDGVCPRTV
ncbi:MAG: hypothetical protein Q4C85_07230 [Actinomyces sp.]|uniref:hypothetical protein n=1 Tax=Actinomyces sp. TaxID=29317 RepID=UPI0026DB2867|nr:hypothetical protein [Actinomyces sp.]MDO4243535.1 hypothetical protein [Actinomyces sp.]